MEGREGRKVGKWVVEGRGGGAGGLVGGEEGGMEGGERRGKIGRWRHGGVERGHGGWRGCGLVNGMG